MVDKKSNTKKMGFADLNILAFGRGKVILFHRDDTEYVEDDFVYWVRVKKAWTIRNWGTEWGLGQLSTNGPTSETILDAIPHGLLIPVGEKNGGGGAIHGIWECTDAATKAFKKPCEESDKQLLK